MSLLIIDLSLYHNVFSLLPDLLCINDFVVLFRTLFLSNGYMRCPGLIWYRRRLVLNLLRVHQIFYSTIQMIYWEDLLFNINAYSMHCMNIKCEMGLQLLTVEWKLWSAWRLESKENGCSSCAYKKKIPAFWSFCNHHAVSQCHFNNE